MMKQAFCYVKGLAKRMKRQATEWEKILANHRLNKGILCRLCKEFQNSREKFFKGKKTKTEF